MYNPVEYYYCNDYYLSQIADGKINRVNTSNSPKKIMMGIEKNDYKTLIKLKTLNLESKEIHPHIVKHKSIKQSFIKLAESILNVSNCLESVTNIEECKLVLSFIKYSNLTQLVYQFME